ncbi:DUF2235 domain-containing protein [Lysobacter capsici]|uniref:DUF2235 domain-containing protein n=1 Tax=Lysobacter capsici TaxID=435897 RepID=UPI000BBAFD52|nr:DUF2235 domain-containing protein [Lysobacter capsici]ATE72743.1 hypothetical protein CNO08_16135 [Lysobacter capsici]
MPKNILIFADGTGQIGGVRPDQQLSNIYKLFRASRVGPDSPIDPREQVAYYEPGLGTSNAAGNVRLGLWERLKSWAGLAVGLGFSTNVIDCYEAILKRYEPGDRIYLFGFSRGGYTVRALANVLNLCGLPTTDGKGGALPRAGRALRAIATEAVVKVYEHGSGHPRKRFEAQREAIARRFRSKYGSGNDPARGDVHPEFIGVFDSVAALGLPVPARLALLAVAALALGAVSIALAALTSHWFDWTQWAVATFVFLASVSVAALSYARITFRWASKDVRCGTRPWHFAVWNSKNYDRYLDPRIPVTRHALAIDETRLAFGRVTWGGSRNADQPGDTRGRFRQRWFAGNHSDIGGSYPEEESRLSDIALRWMIEEAMAGPHPIVLDRSKLHLHPDPLGPQHSEVFARQQGAWWMRLFKWSSAPRPIQEQAELDPTVLERFAAARVVACDRTAAYRPEALRGHHQVTHLY